MNDENQHDDRNDRPGHDSIAESIGFAAGAVDVPDAVDLRRDVQETFERRRRRRRTGLAGAVGVTALVSGLALVAVVGDDGPGDRLVSAPADTAPADSVPEPDDGVGPEPTPGDEITQDDDTQDDDVPVATVAVPSSNSIRLTGASTQQLSDDADSGVDGGGAELFAWNDGFLAIRRSSEPQALPSELPEELAEAFPQEVLDLFPDGLPATLDEATEVLQEAGLYDVVSDIVVSNDEVRDAIYAEQPEQITSVRFSTDGVDWTDVDADLPSGENGYAVRQLVAGDRFVVVTEPAFDSDEAGRYYDVHVSTDLVQWDVQRVELPARTEKRGVQYYVNVEGFAANDSGWVASVSTYADVDVSEFLPADVAAEVDAGRVATSYDSDGVVIERFDDDGNSGERQVFTWDELGLDAMPVPDQDADRVGFVGSWDGVPQQVEVSDSLWRLSSFSGGFVEFGERMRISPDGIDWTDVALPVDGSVGWVLDTADGLLVATENSDGTEHHLLDPGTMTWTPVELSGVPDGAQIDSQSGGGAIVLADYDEPDYVQPSTIRIVADADGYAIEFVLDIRSSSQSGASYELIDTATGEVVVSESVDEFVVGESFTSLTGFETGFFVVIDSDTDEVLVSFEPSQIVQESLDENGDVLPEPDYESYEPDPDHWVVASVSDGLLVEQVITDSDWLSGAAVQGDTVLVATGDGSYIRLTSE